MIEFTDQRQRSLFLIKQNNTHNNKAKQETQASKNNKTTKTINKENKQ